MKKLYLSGEGIFHPDSFTYTNGGRKCSGTICIKHPSRGNIRYWAVQGRRYCMTCRVAFIGNFIRCPCCNYKLRISIRNSKYRQQILESTRVKRY